MMNSASLAHFILIKNGRTYQFITQHGETYESVEDVLQDFRKEFALQKLEADKKRAEDEAAAAAKADADNAAVNPAPSTDAAPTEPALQEAV